MSSPTPTVPPVCTLSLVCGLLGGCEQVNKYPVTAEMFEGRHASTSSASDPPDGGGPLDDTHTDTPDGYGIQLWEMGQLSSDLWTGLMADDGEVYVASVLGARAVLYDLSDGLDAVDEPVLLMSNEPIPGFRLTDISVVRTGDRLVLAASNPEATDIVLAVYDRNGRPIVAPRRVVEGSGAPTNDMKLVARDGLVVLSFGADGDEKHRMVFDRDLAVVSPDTVVIDPAMSSQLGCVVPTDDGFVRVAGNMRNHGLVGVNYGVDWTATDGDVFTLPIPAEEDEWIWFSSGCVQDPQTDDWYVAYQHMWDGDDADTQSSVWIARFDRDWTFLEESRLSDPVGFTRPQLAIDEDTLYVSFDMRFDVRVGRAFLDPDR